MQLFSALNHVGYSDKNQLKDLVKLRKLLLIITSQLNILSRLRRKHRSLKKTHNIHTRLF